MSVEYRVVWKRKGLGPKRKRYVRREWAERFVVLLGPEPWNALDEYRNRDVDARYCCDGWECGCGGLTLREMFMDQRKEMPPIEWVRIESREVGMWTQPEPPHAD